MKRNLLFDIFKIIIILTLTFTVLTSCNKESSDNAEIQLWFYDSDEYYIGYSKEIARKIKKFCDSKNIPLKIFEYSKENMTYDDYLFKRNISAATGNMITIDDARSLIELSKQHADYSKLDNYNNLLDIHKDRYCIPLGINYSLLTMNNEILSYYNIEKQDKYILTYNDYLSIKQEMKEKGAQFKINIKDHQELIHYYLNKNGLLFVDEESEIIKDSNMFKEVIKNSILEICNDIKLFSDGKLDRIGVEVFNDNDNYMHDEKSGLLFYDLTNGSQCITKPVIVNSYSDFGIKDILNKTLYVNIFHHHSPSLYMHKKITNNKIYDVANYILSESCYSSLYEGTSLFIPTFDTADIRKTFQVNEKWEYVGNPGDMGAVKEKDIKNILNKVFSIFVKDQLKEVYDYYYLSLDDSYSYFKGVYSTSNLISECAKEAIIDMAKYLSEDNLVLSLENFDPQNPEIIKIIDDKVNQFVDNFYVHNY